jgi:hypothetical protein
MSRTKSIFCAEDWMLCSAGEGVATFSFMLDKWGLLKTPDSEGWGKMTSKRDRMAHSVAWTGRDNHICWEILSGEASCLYLEKVCYFQNVLSLWIY